MLIETFGIDPYTLRQISPGLSQKISELCEIKLEEIKFFGHEGLMIHNGIEQNTWNVVIKITLQRKLQILQKQIFIIVSNYFKDVAIHFNLYFNYYLKDEKESYINNEYPLYLTENNSLSDEEIFEEDVAVEDIYTGNAFKDFNKKVKK